MRLVFMGSPDFSVPILESLIDAGHEIAAVYCQPPRKAGRGKKERPTPVHLRAIELGLAVRHPVNFKDAKDVEAFAAFNADIAVVVAYGLILPQVILDTPIEGCLNIHASLLPRWRGAAPIHRAIMAGDENTGVSIMQMEAGLDTGPVLARHVTAITAADTTIRLHDRLAQMGATLIVETLAQLAMVTPKLQETSGVIYAHKIDKAESRIDWALSAAEIDRKVRGLSPFPGAWCMASGERLKLLDCEVTDGTGLPGEILNRDLSVACGNGAIRLKSLQRAGKAAMDPSTFLLGFDLPVGSKLS
jgi:methionyl-tRNA formyltransferase